MSLDPSLKALLRQVVAYQSGATVDIAGQVQVGSAATQFARVEPTYREFTLNGTSERSTHIVIMDETFPLTEPQAREALFTIPTWPTARRPKMVRYCYGERGELDHVEIEL